MLVPYNTDAPLYHWPAATVTLIVLNFLVCIIGNGSVWAEHSRRWDGAFGGDAVDELTPEQEQELQDLIEKAHQGELQPEKFQPGQPPAGNNPADEMDEEEMDEDPDDDGLAARRRVPIHRAGFGSLLAQDEIDLFELTVFEKRFGLVYGEGLKPWQWFTALFVHLNPFHLLENMLFLWSFGLVVEGKVGWWRFLMLFLGIGMFINFVTQGLAQLIGTSILAGGYASGASGAIMGLMGLCLVWAPVNEMNVVMWIGWRPFHFEMTIWKLSLTYIVINALVVGLTGIQVTGALMHMMGAGMGFPMGILFLKLNWVDCENWDMFHCLQNKQGKQELMGIRRPNYDKLQWGDDEAKGENTEKTQKLRSKIKRLLKAGDLEAVVPEYEKLKESNGRLDGEDLLKFSELLLSDKQTSEAVPLMEEYLKRCDPQAPKVRLKLAKVYLVENRPKAAAKVLKSMKTEDLAPDLAERRKTFLKKAKEMIDAGTIEFSE